MKKIIAILMVCGLSLMGVHSPVFQAETTDDDPYVFFSDVEDPATLDDIKNYVRVEDDVDGDLTSEIDVIRDNYSGNEDKVGEYVISFSVTDSANQTSTLSITVRNMDVTPPSITVDNPGSLKFPLDSTYTHEQIEVSADDSFDGDVSDSLTFSGSVDTSSMGTYDVTVSAEDSTGNMADKTLEIQVVDVNKPILDGPDEIVKNSEYIMDSDFYLQYFSAEDEEDGDLTSEITVKDNELIGNADKPGIYDMEITVSDSSGNTTSKTLTVKVMDNIQPLIAVDQYDVTVSSETPMSREEIIAYLKTIDDLPDTSFNVSTEDETYLLNNTSPGEYDLIMNLTSSSGEEYHRDMMIEVIEADFDYVEPEPGIFTQAFTFVKTYWIVGVVLVLVGVGIVKKNG